MGQWLAGSAILPVIITRFPPSQAIRPLGRFSVPVPVVIITRLSYLFVQQAPACRQPALCSSLF